MSKDNLSINMAKLAVNIQTMDEEWGRMLKALYSDYSRLFASIEDLQREIHLVKKQQEDIGAYVTSRLRMAENGYNMSEKAERRVQQLEEQFHKLLEIEFDEMCEGTSN